MKKKLQVFVSSTYTDLKEERQAAVEAILDAGHIPAGMELFQAGNESQLDTIKKWIDDSDVYMLILGGRYGSIEPKSGNNYTQIEYEYAIDKRIPIFAVVLTESFLHKKASEIGEKSVFETKNIEFYEQFKKLVMSKMVKTIDDIKDVKLAVYGTLISFLDQYKLGGWVRYNKAVNSTEMTADLSHEVSAITKMLEETKSENIMLKYDAKNKSKEINDAQENIERLFMLSNTLEQTKKENERLLLDNQRMIEENNQVRENIKQIDMIKVEFKKQIAIKAVFVQRNLEVERIIENLLRY